MVGLRDLFMHYKRGTSLVTGFAHLFIQSLLSAAVSPHRAGCDEGLVRGWLRLHNVSCHVAFSSDIGFGKD